MRFGGQLAYATGYTSWTFVGQRTQYLCLLHVFWWTYKSTCRTKSTLLPLMFIKLS